MDAIKLYNQFKLGNSIFSGNYRISNDELPNTRIPDNEIERICISKMVDSLSNLIISNNKSAITKTDKVDYTEYKIDLMVLKVSDFKTIVEAAIQMIPKEHIDKIRSGTITA